MSEIEEKKTDDPSWYIVTIAIIVLMIGYTIGNTRGYQSGYEDACNNAIYAFGKFRYDILEALKHIPVEEDSPLDFVYNYMHNAHIEHIAGSSYDDDNGTHTDNALCIGYNGLDPITQDR